MKPDNASFYLLIAGTGMTFALQVGSPFVVLPWVASHSGAGHLLAVLILPMYQAGQVLAQLSVGPRLAGFKIRKFPVAGAAASMGVALALIGAISSIATPPTSIGPMLLVCALAYGAGSGVHVVGQQDIIAKLIPRDRRGRLLGARATLGGILALGSCLYLHFVSIVVDEKVFLVWMGAAVWGGAALAYLMLREEPGPASTPNPVVAEIQRGISLIGRIGWFRRFMVVRVLVLLIELTLTFAAIHAASVRPGDTQALPLFVAATALGMILSGPVFGRLTDRHADKAILVAGVLSISCGIMALAIRELDWRQTPVYHALIFTLLSLARQGAIQARVNYLAHRAPEDDRPLYISISNALSSILGVLIATILGLVAHLHDVELPIIVLTALIGIVSILAPRLLRDNV